MRGERSHIAYLGLGSNLGDREATIRRAIEMIGEQTGAVEAESALYYSEPWGFESENGFVNAVIRISTTLTPLQLLDVTQSIERQLGKTPHHATVRPTLKSQPLNLNPQPSNLNPQPSNLNPPISNLKPQPSNLQSQISNLQSPISNLKPQISNLQSQTSNLQSPIYKDRPIDIDILLYDDLTIDTPRLKIPHPLMHERPFVMEPLRQVLHS